MDPDTKSAHGKDSVVRDLTAQPQAHLVQAGWHVYDHAGDLIGEVIERDVDSVLVSVAAADSQRFRIPTQLIAEEEESAQRVTLAVEADDLEGLRSLRG
ncbi:MAG TPA: hypothetical protein VK987_09830 [Anaerolineae bacterium]|jgi:hypothetical protein|nr:hypothetical protein [Anaerolineae bacterium]